jgi:hypothetical protein
MPINQDLESLMRIAHVGGGFRFAPSSGLVLFQRVYPEQPRWGNESARYRLTDVAKTWLGLVLSTASNGRIESCGLSAEDREDLIADCSMYLRLLYRHDRSTFHEYLASIRRFIPGYPPRRPLELRLILGDGVNQAADLASGATSIPSWNLTPWMTFGNWF